MHSLAFEVVLIDSMPGLDEKNLPHQGPTDAVDSCLGFGHKRDPECGADAPQRPKKCSQSVPTGAVGLTKNLPHLGPSDAVDPCPSFGHQSGLKCGPDVSKGCESLCGLIDQ